MDVSDGRARWVWTDLTDLVGDRLSSFEDDLSQLGHLEDGVFSVSFSDWAKLGLPTQTADADPFESWSLLQEALCDATVRRPQHVQIKSVGFVGAKDATLRLALNGTDISEWQGFAPGDARPLPSPSVARALEIMQQSAVDRPAQLARWANLRQHLEQVGRLLPLRLRLEFDEYLTGLTVHTPQRFALGWASAKNDRIASLELRVVGVDEPLNLADLDHATGIVSTNARQPTLLPENIAEVARVASRNQRQLVSKVREEIRDPARLLPEGLNVDDCLDLSGYAERVLGFERVMPRSKPLVYQSSGTHWYGDTDDTAFLRLVFRDDAGAEAPVVLETIDDAKVALRTVQEGLANTSSSPVVCIRGFDVVPSDDLGTTIGRAIALREERDADDGLAETPEPPRGTLAAVLEERAEAGDDPNGPLIDESGVPWEVLTNVLLPAVELKAHQRRGIAWLWQHAKRHEPGVLLADDMGLGKTLQVASFLALQIAEQLNGPLLVVAPVVLLDNWIRELGRFFRPDVFSPYCALHGETLRAFRQGPGLDAKALGQFRLVLTNYETLASHQASLLRIPFSFVVFDEAQYVKNETTLRSRGAQGLKRQMAIAVTGTPVENKLSDMWAIFEAIQQSPERRSFGNRKQFESTYEQTGAEGIQAVRERLAFPSERSILLRREKAQALRDLPPKIFHECPIAMTENQHHLEKVIVREVRTKGPLGVLDKLRKLYQHPALVVSNDRAALDPRRALEESPKTTETIRILRDIRDRGEKALIFTQWVAMQDLLRLVLINQLQLARVNVINGDPLQRSRAQNIIDQFTASQGFDVLILSPLAAGVGLTITAANHVIHYGRWWNPAKEDQATDRAHRIGQTKSVHVYYPILHHPNDTDGGFDVKLHRLIERKKHIAHDFLAAESDESIERELEDVLKGAQAE